MIDENFRLTYAIGRKKDRRKYIVMSTKVYENYNLAKSEDYFKCLQALEDLTIIQQKMLMFWFYDGHVRVNLTNSDQNDIPVKSKYTKEEALEYFSEWPSGAPKYKPLPEKTRFDLL